MLVRRVWRWVIIREYVPQGRRGELQIVPFGCTVHLL
jgi:hypothetical protein